MPCSRSTNGRTNSRNVTKLDTGFPGSPMKLASPPSARRTAPYASGRPGLIAIRHRSSRPSAVTAGFT